MPTEPPDGRQYRRIDADDLAVHVEQRPPGVAFIDGSVSLDVVIVGTAIDVAVARRDNARRHRTAEPKRIADGQHPIADPRFVAIAELHRLQGFFGLYAQNGDVDFLILADDFGLQLLSVREDHRDFARIGDDVIIGHDDAGGVDDEARSQGTRLALMRKLRTLALLATPEELLEQIIEWRARRQSRRALRTPAHSLLIESLRRRNIDHGVGHLRRKIGEGFGPSSKRRPSRHRHRGYGGNQRFIRGATR